MTGRYDPAPVRLEPHPADDRLALLGLDRPPVNAFDQRMGDLFADLTASLHGGTLYRAGSPRSRSASSPAPAAPSGCPGSSDPCGPRR
jgi:hypothetical protein